MVWSQALSAIGGLGSAFLGSASNSASAARQFEYQKALQAQAAQLNYDYSLKYAKNSPGATREGLESANYNPMLAVQSGMSNASSFTSAGSAGTYDNANAVQQGVANALDFNTMRNNTMMAESQSDANYANADLTKINKATEIAKLPYVSKQAKANYAKTAMETADIENQIHNRDEQVRLLEKQIEMSERIARINSNATVNAAGVGASATKYSADINANSTPFKAGANLLQKHGKTLLNKYKEFDDKLWRKNRKK